MSNLIILRGNSGSGKTTLSKRIQKRLGKNTLLIPQDTVRREMLNAKDGATNPSIPLLINLLEYGHEDCDYVILEGILNAKWYLPVFERAKELFGDRINAYYFDIPFEETMKRHQERHIASFGEEKMCSWWLEKDYIGFIPEKKFTSEMSLEDELEVVMDDERKKK
ncbi:MULTISPECIES: kinase [Lactobacillus]|uniref:Uridine kinase n=1 Tax=Lactobacillus xujianguonis TaxID=2495899 RepID=A0A437SXG3_9LACO|nr:MULTISPECIES: kinase [Lactobacillus]RVU71598.1 uridine kinase [Lactobacillus xujianguonis]RVU77751.1 uridine kinase [Lactobacillus xujianguonis]